VVPALLEISQAGAGTPPDLGFGEVSSGVASAPQAVTVLNVGNAPLTLGTAELGGSHPQDFRIRRDTCSRDRFGRDSACLIQVVFTPTTEATAAAELLVLSRTGEILGTATLSGTGGPPEGGGP
jgi:hypothetical protein